MVAGGFAKYYTNYYLVHNLCMFAGKINSAFVFTLLCAYTFSDAIIMVMKEGRKEITEEDLVMAESKKDARAIRRQMAAATSTVEDIELRWRYECLILSSPCQYLWWNQHHHVLHSKQDDSTGNGWSWLLLRRVDEVAPHGDRIRLWDEINTTWLSILPKQKDILESGN